MKTNPSHILEAATGFEPVNNGFADRCLSHLAMPPKNVERWNGGTLEKWPVRHPKRPKVEIYWGLPLFLSSIIPEFVLERETGLEPATTTLATWSSTS